MKKMMAAATALTLLTATASFAEDATPTMPAEIVSQDATATGADGGVLVPILMMLFLLMTAGSGDPV